MPFSETFSTLWAAFVEWFKRSTTADALKDGSKTFAWVAMLTILIWIYAEQRQRTEEPGQTVLIALHSAEGDRIVSFVRPHDDVPIITMKGPKQAVDDAKKQLAGEKGIITIDVPSELTPGVRNVTIDLPIKEASIFRKNGIEVTDVSPRTIEVRIEPLRTYELDVAAPPGANLDGSATFEPKTVKIRAPQDVFNDAATKNGGKLTAFAQIPPGSDLAKPGSHNDVKLSIQLPIQGDNVALLSAPTVQATYAIKQSSIQMDIQSLVVRTSFVGNTANDLVVDLSQPTVSITIVGPPEKCAKVVQRAASNEPVPYAMVQIDAVDVLDVRNGTVATKPLTKTLTYDLGDPDVIVKDPTKTIDVVIHKRPQS